MIKKQNDLTNSKPQIYKTKISRKMIVSAIIVFLIVFILTETFLFMSAKLDIESKKNKVAYSEAMVLEKIGSAFDKIESKMNSIITFTIDDDGNVSEFERAATSIVGERYVKSIALAPKGVVEYLYPKTVANNTFGYDFYEGLFVPEIEVEKDDLGKPFGEKRTMIAGPYLYADGKTYMGIRVPVFLYKGDAERELWGFAYAVIDFPAILTREGLDMFSTQGYNYKLYKVEKNGQENKILSIKENKINDGVTVMAMILNQEWRMIAEPDEGWKDSNWYIFTSLFMMFVSFLASMLMINYYKIKETRNLLARLVNIDTLTGVFSRKYLYDYVYGEIQRNRKFAICYIDVDRFKEVNDRFGHEAGDVMLVEIADRIQDCIRINDFVARVGGDEFIIFIADINETFDGKVVLNRIEKRMLDPMSVGNTTFFNSISVGYSVFPEDGTNIEELIQKADAYMYNMKAKHRNNENE